MTKLKVLQIGAGSMGTRRLRDLSKRDDVELALFDQRKDRRAQAENNFNLNTFDSLENALDWSPDALSISTPPNQHDKYISIALDRKIHHFCEENIWTYDYKLIEQAEQQDNLVCANSCSFHFLPVVKKLKKIKEESLGQLHSYQMNLSVHALGWHPAEGNEYYARNRNTSAGREMVPFELIWLNDVFGSPEKVMGSVDRFAKLENLVEDTWCLQMNLDGGGIGQLTVIHGVPFSIRQGICLGEGGHVCFDLRTGKLIVKIADEIEKTIYCGHIGEVLEATYFDEINTFIDAILGKKEWPISYYDSAIATATLGSAEKSSDNGLIVNIIPEVQPEQLA